MANLDQVALLKKSVPEWNLWRVEVVKQSKVRRAKLCYLCELRGKAARLKEVRVQ